MAMVQQIICERNQDERLPLPLQGQTGHRWSRMMQLALYLVYWAIAAVAGERTDTDSVGMDSGSSR